MQDANEDVGATGEFGVAVLKKSVADDQSKRDCEPILGNRQRSEGQTAKCQSKRHARISA